MTDGLAPGCVIDHLLVVGSHGRGATATVTPGSTAIGLLEAVAAPLTVVPAIRR